MPTEYIDEINTIEKLINRSKDTNIIYLTEDTILNTKAVQMLANYIEKLQKENEDWQKAYQEEKDEQFNMLIKKCLHCGNDTPLYCEKCYQELISKNAELQLENEELRKEVNEENKRCMLLAIEKQDLIENSIPKQVIRDKIEEVNKEYKKYTEKWEKSGMNKEHPFYKYIVRLEAQIEILEELLGE